ncbi:hypothetical protein A4A49_19211 [Nicotiana attenuata]|uniref:Uncharacterized protein n=2 Tax=Nicotiana attenuata TaxID=49451 RepID=A0A1J6KZX5_NICAT|nr:hypothetical protein A4A49_19211 [Nicotiana attenuata]
MLLKISPYIGNDFPTYKFILYCTHTFNFPMLKMKRTELLLYLLLIWTIWAACQHDYNFIPTAQAIKAVTSNKSSLFYTLRSTRRHILANLGKYAKIYKPPSGPNPTGNHRPPSRAKPNRKSSSTIKP